MLEYDLKLEGNPQIEFSDEDFFLYSKSKLNSINSVRRAFCMNNVHNVDNVENRSKMIN